MIDFCTVIIENLRDKVVIILYIKVNKIINYEHFKTKETRDIYFVIIVITLYLIGIVIHENHV